jgi:hypothetical protein
VFEVVIVILVVTTAPEGVTVEGEKLQLAPAGTPEQLKLTAELNPLLGVTEIVVVPLCPAVTVIEIGETVIEKSGGVLVMV